MNPIEQLARRAAAVDDSPPVPGDEFARGVLAGIRAAGRTPDRAAWGVAASVAAAAAVAAVLLAVGPWSSLSNPLSNLNDNTVFALESQ